MPANPPRTVRSAALVAAVLLLAAAPAAAAEPTVRLVEVDADVHLETVDWGGSGPDVVLMAGMGHTAHVWDAFARRLAADYRVVGVTRRGFGASTHSINGYDPLTLARDVARACDALEIARPVLLGHSLAGTEIAWFESRYPGRARAVVLLDAAYDHSRITEIADLAPPPRQAPPSPADLTDAAALRDWLRRTRGPLFPEVEIEALYVFTEDGRLKDANSSPLAQGLVIDALEPPPWRRVDAPALAVFAKPTLRSLYPANGTFDREALQTARRRVAMLRQFMSADLATFEASCPQADVVVRDGANHHLFLTEPTLVLTAVRAFLAGLDSGGLHD